MIDLTSVKSIKLHDLALCYYLISSLLVLPALNTLASLLCLNTPFSCPTPFALAAPSVYNLLPQVPECLLSYFL